MLTISEQKFKRGNVIKEDEDYENDDFESLSISRSNASAKIQQKRFSSDLKVDQTNVNRAKAVK